MKFYNLGEVRRQTGDVVRRGDFDSAPEEFSATAVDVAQEEFLVIFPKFLDPRLYAELANTLASRYAMEVGSVQVGPPVNLKGREAWLRLQGMSSNRGDRVEGQSFFHHWRGLEVPILVFILEKKAQA